MIKKIGKINFLKTIKNLHKINKQFYCAICAEKHQEQDCPFKNQNKSQFNTIRERFAQSIANK